MGFAKAWPTRTGEFADKMNTVPKYVVSTTLTRPQWDNTVIVDGNALERIRHLKKQERG
jgi:hypothetical protein